MNTTIITCIHTAWRRRTQKTEEIQINRFNNQIFRKYHFTDKWIHDWRIFIGTLLCKTRTKYFTFCWPCISTYLLVGDQLGTQFFYIIRLFQSSTCFKQTRAHHQEVNCINTASSIVRYAVREVPSRPAYRTATYR